MAVAAIKPGEHDDPNMAMRYKVEAMEEALAAKRHHFTCMYNLSAEQVDAVEALTKALTAP